MKKDKDNYLAMYLNLSFQYLDDEDPPEEVFDKLDTYWFKMQGKEQDAIKTVMTEINKLEDYDELIKENLGTC